MKIKNEEKVLLLKEGSICKIQLIIFSEFFSKIQNQRYL